MQLPKQIRDTLPTGTVRRYSGSFVGGCLEGLIRDSAVDEHGQPVRLRRALSKLFVETWRTRIDPVVMDEIQTEAVKFLQLNADELILYVSYLAPIRNMDAWAQAGEAYALARNGIGAFKTGREGASLVEALLTQSANECGRLRLVFDGNRFVATQALDHPTPLSCVLSFSEINIALGALVSCYNYMKSLGADQLSDIEHEVATKLVEATRV